MKILAMERELPGVQPDQFAQHLKPEALRVWGLYSSGALREMYFTRDGSEAVLMLECSDEHEAVRLLDELPLVRAGLIRFDIFPLVPYTGFARLFSE